MGKKLGVGSVLIFCFLASCKMSISTNNSVDVSPSAIQSRDIGNTSGPSLKILVLNTEVGNVIDQSFQQILSASNVRMRSIGYNHWAGDYKNGDDQWIIGTKQDYNGWFPAEFNNNVVDTYFNGSSGWLEYCRDIEKKAADYYKYYRGCSR